MTRRKARIISGAILFVAAAVAGSPPAAAQTVFQNYRCADGSRFIAGFFNPDTRAHLQIDGKAVTLGKRLALSGKRYSSGGVTLNIAKAGGVTLKRARRAASACELT
jgi:membrane-bound inhibitor of C-type lysozyme